MKSVVVIGSPNIVGRVGKPREVTDLRGPACASLGRTTQVAKKICNVTYTTGYTYNLAGGVVNATYPSGRVVKHEYDNIGRLKNVKNNGTGASYLSNAAYSTASQLTGFTYGNSVVASYGYSANRLQLTSLSYAKSGTTHLSLSYSYSQSGNNNGQIASITDNQQSGRTVSYTYDSLHRLKTAVTNGSGGYPQWGLSWSYDRYGNRTGQSVTHGSGPSSSPTISTSTNRITALGGYTYYYDSNGNLTQDDLFKYKYDAENRVVEIRNLSDTLLTSYAYDGHSMQVIKVAGGTRTWFLYAGSQLVSEYYDAAANTYSSPTTPGSAPSDSQSTLLYQHADHLTTRVTTDNAGTLSNQQAHYPYGENWYATGTADPSVKRKFTSYRKETDSSLASGQINYAVARYHGARTGRFQMADPNQGYVGNPQRLNRYAYVLGDATNRSDPSGQDQCDMPLDVWLIYNLPWVGLGDEPPPIVNPYAFGGGPGYCYGGVFSGPQTGPVCVTPTVPTLSFVNSTHPPTPVLGCAVPSEGSGAKCFAKLRGRSGTIPQLVGAVHVFWHVRDRTGAHFILS
jgi:RHS repeat-associated protein